MIMLAATGSSTVGFAEALVGVPVAVVIVSLCLYGWHLLRNGTVVLGREHDELREDRDWWRNVATRALNIGEAVAARQDDR